MKRYGRELRSAAERGAGAIVALLILFGVATGAEPWAAVPQRPENFLGTLSCSSVSCHGRTEAAYGAEARGQRSEVRGQGPLSSGESRVSQQEYVLWRGRDATYEGGRRHYDPRARLESAHGDPHALAGQRIFEPRFQEVLKRASNLPDGKVDPQMYERCARCHDPMGLVDSEARGAGTLTPALSQSEREALLGHGIGCETCHGGARKWITNHYERGMTRERLLELGMVDTKNVLVRAQLCTVCHVGTAEQDVNHDLLGAGHPPLRFELASFQAALEGKHWDDGPRRLTDPNYEVQLWAVGRVVAAEAGLALVEGRARKAEVRGQKAEVGGQKSEFRGAWPEFAEYSCFACHQPLRPGFAAGEAVAGRDGLGTPRWQTWNVTLTGPLLVSRTAKDELPSPGKAFGEGLEALRGEMDRTLFTAPDRIASQAAEARAALLRQVHLSPKGKILGASGGPIDAEDVLATVAAEHQKVAVTWEGCCQELAAILAAERSARDRLAQQSASERVSEEQKVYFGAQTEAVRRRARQIGAALRFVNGSYEWPGVFPAIEDNGIGTRMSLAEAAAELDAVRRELAAALELVER